MNNNEVTNYKLQIEYKDGTSETVFLDCLFSFIAIFMCDEIENIYVSNENNCSLIRISTKFNRIVYNMFGTEDEKEFGTVLLYGLNNGETVNVEIKNVRSLDFEYCENYGRFNIFHTIRNDNKSVMELIFK